MALNLVKIFLQIYEAATNQIYQIANHDFNIHILAQAASNELEENINHVIARELSEDNVVEARTVEDAVAVLSLSESKIDRHPERRLRAAYTTYEEQELPKLRQEYPNLRLSQVKQMVKKNWQKSPDNPMNQIHAVYNQKS